METNTEELNEEIDKNFQDRLDFIKFWAKYVKTHPDKEWSKQQNVVIDSQMPKRF